MNRLRIALLNAAHDGDHTRRNFRREIDADLVEYNVTEGDFPEGFGFDACVVTGSRASVYWDEPWIGDLERWVGEAIETGMPALGVCFGHQLLADVLGGSVADMGEYEIGYREIEHSGDSLLFEGIDERFTAFTTHSDYVERLPPGAELLAENDYGVHAFRDGQVFAVQFHPEYDMRTARKITEGKEQLSEQRRERILDGITEENYAAACRTKALFENFTQFVRRHRETADAAGAAGD
ncbi:hypothetical protein GRX03_03845 [Halovenus sp. WSH3]|uniref:Glutamine amidotransferase domain-containing protein n=1 Tax=Halovenus carboxidivorans TaxID=2692199 RepID=A0A6B0SYA0_9EURY|nr:type 1 glutamine amidotransferase [Halovenus carboxidivorans]MXR50738.1 hypothetical protein [Halovenus carboxidivorans]